jgi:type II secretory pathway component PulF
MNSNPQTKYIFTAKDIEGKVVNGNILALSKEYATKILFEKDLQVVSILSEKEFDAKNNIGQRDVSEYFNFGGIFEKVGLKNIVNFSKQMSALLDAGVSVVKALQLVNEEEKNPLMRKALETVVADVKGGKSISTAFAKHPRVFSDFYTNMIRSGEESGKMSQSFFYLSEYVDRNYTLVTKVRNAMIYPAFVIIVFFIVMILIFTMVITRFF